MVNAKVYAAGMAAAEAQIDRLIDEKAKLIEALEWIIPMAKGYAVEHDVGRNREIVNHARAVLDEVKGPSIRGSKCGHF